MELGIESGRLRTGRLQQDEWFLLNEGINSLSKLPLHITDKPISSIQEMQLICQKIKDESTKKSLGLVILDYVQLLDYLPISDISNREEYLLKLAKSLKRMAEELNVPVIVISQLSKDVEKRRNKRPMLSDINDFEPLEVYSDIITMIYRDEYYNPETEDRGIAEIITCKHRNGPLGTVKLLFEPQFTRYRNLAA
jgi:replicative DNA helicase